MANANYRKHNDGSQKSSTYHKKDGTEVRAILKREVEEQINEMWEEHSGEALAYDYHRKACRGLTRCACGYEADREHAKLSV